MGMRLRLGAGGLTAAVGLAALLPAAAAAEENIASLAASFSPDRYGASTTIGFSFQLSTSEGLAPPPLKAVNLHMPAGLNYTTTSLGLAICQPQALIERGAGGCPTNARIGSGSAFVEVPFGHENGRELPEIQAFMGPPNPQNGNMVVIFYANGEEPVFAQLIFTGELVPASGAFGADLNTTIPLVPSVPNGPPVAIVKVSTTIGPGKLVYYKRVHGQLVSFHPVGISVPYKCPSGGFPFAADFIFYDGSTAHASTTVPCPPPVKHRHHKRRRH